MKQTLLDGRKVSDLYIYGCNLKLGVGYNEVSCFPMLPFVFWTFRVADNYSYLVMTTFSSQILQIFLKYFQNGLEELKTLVEIVLWINFSC